MTPQNVFEPVTLTLTEGGFNVTIMMSNLIIGQSNIVYTALSFKMRVLQINSYQILLPWSKQQKHVNN